MKSLYVLDSCAFIAFLRAEEGSDKIDLLLQYAIDKKISVIMHKINFTEVYYDILRTSGEKEANKLFSKINLLPIEIATNLNDDFVKTVAFFKVNHKVSFADCFALALAKNLDASLVTSDHHEFDAIEKTKAVKFTWIR